MSYYFYYIVLQTNLKTSTLTGPGLLLDGHDLQDLVLQLLAEEEVDDFRLLDGKGVEVDLLERLDLAVLDEATELGHWLPLKNN